jgi:hypothetical protein
MYNNNQYSNLDYYPQIQQNYQPQVSQTQHQVIENKESDNIALIFFVLGFFWHILWVKINFNFKR